MSTKLKPIAVDDLQVFTITECAQRIKVAKDTFYRWCRAGRVHTVRMGDRVVVPITMRAGVKIGHSTPRERCVAAE